MEPTSGFVPSGSKENCAFGKQGILRFCPYSGLDDLAESNILKISARGFVIDTAERYKRLVVIQVEVRQESAL